MKSKKLVENTMLALQGKLVEADELDGQISFDDVQKQQAEDKKGKYVYETDFHLKGPVTDFSAAYDYLTADNMIQYLRDEFDFTDQIGSVEWILEDEESGKIVVRAYKELTDEELNKLSDWIRGQNSDGLGEGFEQQDFSEVYFDPVTGDGPYTRQEAEREVEKLFDNLSTDDLVREGALNNAIWEAVEVYKDEHEDEVEEMDDDDIYNMIEEDPEKYLDQDTIEEAKYEYTKNDEQYNEDDWYVMCSFDWETNDYKLHRVQ